MKLTREQVRHVAGLARLSLSAEEEQRAQVQLSAILDAVEQLKGVDTENVEPTSHASLAEGALRKDLVEPSLPAEKAVANAPAKHGTQFGVPKILE